MDVRLVLLGPEHCEAVLAFCRANAGRLKAGALSSFPEWSDDYPRWLGSQLASLEAAQGGRLTYGLLRPDGAVVGVVGVERLQRFHGACVWYAVDSACQGLGLAKTGVLRAMLAFGDALVDRGDRPPPRWVVHALPANTRSLALAASLGFKRDEMLDYTKHSSARGPGRKLVGLMLECNMGELRARMLERDMQFKLQSNELGDAPLTSARAARKRQPA